jgi:hypothetical protein
MIGHRKDGSEHEFQIGCSIMGDQFTRIELTNDDFRYFTQMKDSPTQASMILEWLSVLHCRLAPGAK